jgi:hypothetical protein
MIQKKTIITFMKYSLISISCILLISISALYFFRNDLAHYAVTKANEKLLKKYNTQLSVASIRVNGISEIEIEQLVVKPLKADTLFQSKNLKISIRLLPLLAGKIRPDRFFIHHAVVNIIQKGGTDNFSMFFKSQRTKNNTKTDKNYALVADKILDGIFGKIPRDIDLQDLLIYCQLDSDSVYTSIPSMQVNDHKIQASIILKENKRISNFSVQGNIDAGHRKFDLSISKKDSGRIQLPFLESKWAAKVGFNEIVCSFNQTDQSNSELRANITVALKGTYVNQEKIAPEEILLSDVMLDYKLRIEKEAIEIDSLSSVTINSFKSGIHARYERSNSQKIELGIRAPWFNAQDFFNALPKGLFTTLKGIKTQGKLDYTFKLAVDIDHPDSIEFISDLKQNNFKVVSFGETNLTKINSDFILPVYDNERFVRNLTISPTNPYYISYNQLPQNLVYALLTSEDGGFMRHRGFNIDAFKKSISENIKTKRFKRGGSTISMQLVKNVYLNKNKTISRKVEEIILVWLIENLRLSSKERMLEVYFNIIEWGPNIYGVGEASQFYFNKQPGELNWNEAIYMASIVPSPKRFARKFDEQGDLKQQEGYYKLLANIMVRRGQMTEAEKDSLKPNVYLSGTARSYLKFSTDSISQVTAEEQEELDLIELK